MFHSTSRNDSDSRSDDPRTPRGTSTTRTNGTPTFLAHNVSIWGTSVASVRPAVGIRKGFVDIRLSKDHMEATAYGWDGGVPAVTPAYLSNPAALSSCVIFSTACSTSDGFFAPVQTSFPLPNSRTTTFGSSRR